MLHAIVTRLGIGIQTEIWFDSALDLFEAITFPSLRAQVNGEFVVLLVIDEAMPAAPLERLRRIVAADPRFHLVPLSLPDTPPVVFGGFSYVWDRCLDYLLSEALVSDPCEYAITSVLDADDAWAK